LKFLVWFPSLVLRGLNRGAINYHFDKGDETNLLSSKISVATPLHFKESQWRKFVGNPEILVKIIIEESNWPPSWDI
jgi:hypothetical protein